MPDLVYDNLAWLGYCCTLAAFVDKFYDARDAYAKYRRFWTMY